MRIFFRYVCAFIFGLTTFLSIGLVGLVFYASFEGLLGFMILGLVGILGIYLALKVFRTSLIMGPMNMISGVHASRDLDNLIPTAESEV